MHSHWLGTGIFIGSLFFFLDIFLPIYFFWFIFSYIIHSNLLLSDYDYLWTFIYFYVCMYSFIHSFTHIFLFLLYIYFFLNFVKKYLLIFSSI